MVIEAPDEGGALPMEGVFPRMTMTPGSVRHAGKSMGADNDEIFAQRLGLSEDEIAALKDEGVL